MTLPVKLDLAALYKFFAERWPRRSTPVLLLLIMLVVMIPLASSVNLPEISIWWWLIMIVLACAILATWRLTTRIPKNPKGRVGILVAISHEDPAMAGSFRHDFTQRLRELLQGGNRPFRFKLLELSEYHSSQIKDQEDAARYLRRSQCHFLLYGRVRQRSVGGALHHFMNLDGIVVHRPIPTNVSQSFAVEIGSLLPRKLQIAQEGDIFAFEFTAHWTDSVCRYIIGIASLLSDDYAYAISLFEDLKSRLDQVTASVPAINSLKARVPDRLEFAYMVALANLHGQWRITSERNLLGEMQILADKLLALRPNNSAGHLYAAICAFMLNRDLKRSMREIKQCRRDKNRTWRYSEAFLLAYQGRMGAAISSYRTAFARPSADMSVPLQCEEFILEVLQQEPDKVQLYFCLGLINLEGKGDRMAAKRDFAQFLALCPAEKFVEEQEMARTYIERIDAEPHSNPPSEAGQSKEEGVTA